MLPGKEFKYILPASLPAKGIEFSTASYKKGFGAFVGSVYHTNHGVLS
jgi:hypothetical protein